MIKVEVNYRVNSPQKFEAFFEKILKKAAAEFKIKSMEISVALVSRPTIKELNLCYRHKAAVTDVLSFEEVNEIVICLAQAKIQSKKKGRGVTQEVVFLFVHGLLHLLGFKHQTDRAERQMNGLTDKILRASGFLN